MKKSTEIHEISDKEHAPKKHKSHQSVGHGAHEEEEGEPWLLSYADMVTLLMCFFILFFTLDKSKGGISDPERVKNKIEKMISIDAAILSPPWSPDSSTDSNSSNADQNENKSSKLKEQFVEEFKSFTKNLKIVFSLSSPNPATLELTFLTSNFFSPGSDLLTDPAKEMLAKAAPRLLALSPKTLIEVEGHTDSDPIHNDRFQTNWDLSTARASSVAKFLSQKGIKPQQLKISGFGPYRPLAKEKDEQGLEDISAKKLNRRVILRISLDRASAEAKSQITK